MRYFLTILVLAVLILSISKCKKIYKNDSQETSVQDEDFMFSNALEIKILKNLDGDTIPFSLQYVKDTFHIVNGIKIQEINLSFNNLFFDFGLGIKNDTLFSCSIIDDSPKVLNIQPCFTFNNQQIPQTLPKNMLGLRRLVLDSIYFLGKEKVFRIDIFNDLPFESSEKYSFHKFYFTRQSGIKIVEIKENGSGLIYSNN